MQQMELPHGMFEPAGRGPDLARLRHVYTPTEVARWAKTTPQSTNRWLLGYSYPTLSGRGWSYPVAGTAHEPGEFLNFDDLMEVAIITAARKGGVTLPRLKKDLETAQAIYDQPRPLLALQFYTDGRELFVMEDEGRHVNLSRAGQVAWDHIKDILHAVDYDGDVIARWWPAGRDVPIFIDPKLSFGKPIVEPLGISTSAIHDRFAGGESMEELAEDYGIPSPAIQAAIRFETPPPKH